MYKRKGFKNIPHRTKKTGHNFTLTKRSPYKVIRKFKAFVYKILALLPPKTGLTVAGLIGQLGYYLYLGASAKDVQNFLGILPNNHSNQIAKQITINFMKNELFKFLLAYGAIEKLANLIQYKNEQNLLQLYRNNKPAIIVYSHLGPNLAAMVGLYKLGISFLSVQPKEYYSYPEQIDFLQVPELKGLDYTPYILKSAYTYLKNNGFVLIAIDGFMGKSIIQVEFMQRQYPFQRGIASLHRLTGAPIIPISVEWKSENNRIDFSAHDQIEIPSDRNKSPKEMDELLTTNIVKWLEHKITSSPHQLRLNQLRKYLSGPQW